jgi:GrpB-like predicted nucleotidyltransferase (UPF0157 family)
VATTVVDYDEAWPSRLEAVAGQVRRALGSRGLSAEHIGYTSVPGLAAKPIIDMLSSVDSGTDEAAHFPALEPLGFTLRAAADSADRADSEEPTRPRSPCHAMEEAGRGRLGMSRPATRDRQPAHVPLAGSCREHPGVGDQRVAGECGKRCTVKALGVQRLHQHAPLFG